jgi:hypothetical protein
MSEKLEAELADLIEQLRPGGTEAQCVALREQIAAVRREIERTKQESSSHETH